MQIESFISELEANGRSKHTVQSYRDVLKRLNAFKDLDEMTKADLVSFFTKFNGTDETKRLYQAKVKKFFTDMGKPELVSWIKLIKISEALNSDEVLNTDDVNRLLEASDNMYLKAWISIAFESGARFNEIKQLRYKDLKETSEGMIAAIPTSKNDAIRPSILLTASSNYLRNLKAHTMMSDTDIIFPMSRQGLSKHLKAIQTKAGITKPCNPHRMRHAQATDMVLRGYNESIIKAKMGWTKRSNMASRYVHLNDQSVIDATLRTGGKVTNTKPITELKQADKITLVDAAMQFNKLTDENRELKERLDGIEHILASVGKSSMIDSIAFDKDGVTMKGTIDKEMSKGEAAKLKKLLESIIEKR
jgi:site-specific recombinase XerD